MGDMPPRGNMGRVRKRLEAVSDGDAGLALPTGEDGGGSVGGRREPEAGLGQREGPQQSPQGWDCGGGCRQFRS